MPEAKRQLSLTIDLGGEQILVERIEMDEALGQPFLITADIIALSEVDLLPHLGKAATATVTGDDGPLRHFNGILTDGEYLSEELEGFRYRLRLRPWTYLLSQNRDYAIFQDKSTLDIIKQVLEPSRFAEIEYSKLTTSPRTRSYCVQYGESDFAFISRLLEEEGFYYFFRHEKTKHLLVLCDAPGSHLAGTPATLQYNPSAGAGHAVGENESGQPFVTRWHERVTTAAQAKVTMREWDYEKPQQPVEKVAAAETAHPLDALEVFVWPGHFAAAADGTRASEVALAALRAPRRAYAGESWATGLACGTTMTLAGHLNERFNAAYLVTRTHHEIAAEVYRGGRQVSEAERQVTFEAIPAAVQWQAPQVTPRPMVKGPESAIVTGPGGEEIFTDSYGRVKVRFHWDRSGTAGDKSTCWIRVSQTGGLGNVIMPRVGHEVIVDFLDGDPDRPLVVGRVFNGENMPIYELPEGKTRAVWRTKRYGTAGSYPGAKALDIDPAGGNELRFEDKGGKEEVFLYAERDMTLRVRNSESQKIGLDQAVDIGGSRDVAIEGSDKNEVGKSISIKAGTTIEIEAQTSITLKVGQTSIKIEPAGVTVKTTMLKMEAQAMAEIKSPMTTVKGDGMLTLKGGVTMIN